MPDGPITVGGVDALRHDDGPVFAVIGVFDGIHRGHRYLLRHLDLEAERRHARPAVITFDSHPDEVILGVAPPLLLDPAERLRLLGEAGVEVVVVQHFDATLRSTEYDEFVHRITSRTRLAGLLMTPDAAFGHDRRGTPEAVAALGAREGFDVVVVPPFEIDGRSVRSSDIRAAIAAGDLAQATKLLGRPYAIVGATAADDAAGQTRVTLVPPCALPPDGPWRAVVAPWPSVQDGPAGADAEVRIERGSIVLRGAPPAAAVEITFVGA